MRYLKVFLITFLLTISFNCSKDDNIQNSEEIFLSANIDGINSLMDMKTANFQVKKMVRSSGILYLSIEVTNFEGESMRFIIPAYSGKNIYIIGNDDYLPNSIEYKSINANRRWICDNPGINSLQKNYIEILKDDGRKIEGTFSFKGQNFEDLSIKIVTEGKFKLTSE